MNQLFWGTIQVPDQIQRDALRSIFFAMVHPWHSVGGHWHLRLSSCAPVLGS
jgi:hypothetical protein